MHPFAHELIGMSIQKIETTKRGIVSEVKEGWLPSTTIVVFGDGYQGMYRDNSIPGLIEHGCHFQNCE